MFFLFFFREKKAAHIHTQREANSVNAMDFSFYNYKIGYTENDWCTKLVIASVFHKFTTKLHPSCALHETDFTFSLYFFNR